MSEFTVRVLHESDTYFSEDADKLHKAIVEALHNKEPLTKPDVLKNGFKVVYVTEKIVSFKYKKGEKQES